MASETRLCFDGAMVKESVRDAVNAALTFALIWLLAGCRCGEPEDDPRDGQADDGEGGDAALKARPLPILGPSGLESIEFVTGGASADEALPLVIALHGLGDEPTNYSEFFKTFDRKVRFVFPRGRLPHEEGYAWMQPSGPTAKVGPMIENSTDRVASLIDETVKSRPTKGKAIVTGFSQGGVISFMVAARHPERVGAAIPVAGVLPQFAWPDEARFLGHSPIIRALNGETDELIPALDVRRCVVKLRMLKVDATMRLYRGVGHSISSAMRDDYFSTLSAFVVGVSEPQPCEPCSADSIDPVACTLCEDGEVEGKAKSTPSKGRPRKNR